MTSKSNKIWQTAELEMAMLLLYSYYYCYCYCYYYCYICCCLRLHEGWMLHAHSDIYNFLKLIILSTSRLSHIFQSLGLHNNNNFESQTVSYGIYTFFEIEFMTTFYYILNLL
jgi:hypothetical protein